MSQIQSTLLSEKPLIEGDSVTLPIVKVGTKAYSADGREFTLTKCALESGAESWKDGIATVNHKRKVDGKISSSWFEDPYVYATFEGLSQETVDVINSAAYRGVSQESQPIELEGSNVMKLVGTGSTFVIFPDKPSCSMSEGCGIISSTEAAVSEDEDRHDFDIATINNAGTRIKTRETSVWLFGEDREDPEALKRRITQEVGFGGLGIYYVYYRDDTLSLGDEIPDDREPEHTVTITVSNSPVFNFDLNTPKQEHLLYSSGGNNLSEDTIKDLKDQISSKDQEIADLKSTVTDLKGELKTKDEGIASTVQAAVTAALESHDAQAAQKADHDAAVTELASCMPAEALESFMSTKPSVDVIKSTTAAIKSSLGKQVGADGGDPPESLVSTHDEWNAATGGE